MEMPQQPRRMIECVIVKGSSRGKRPKRKNVRSKVQKKERRSVILSKRLASSASLLLFHLFFLL